MRLDTPIGQFMAHFHLPEPSHQQTREMLVHQLRTAQAKPRQEQDRLYIGKRVEALDRIAREKEYRLRAVTAVLHRGPCPPIKAGIEIRRAMERGHPCCADSAAAATLTIPERRFRRDRARTDALQKTMFRLGLNKDERRALWASYFAQWAGPLARRCVAVVTICPDGHRHRVEAIGQPRMERATTESGREVYAVDMLGLVSFPSAREFCGAEVEREYTQEVRQEACEQPTIASKHRYLYTVELPISRGMRKRLAQARARALPAAPTTAVLDPAFESGFSRENRIDLRDKPDHLPTTDEIPPA